MRKNRVLQGKGVGVSNLPEEPRVVGKKENKRAEGRKFLTHCSGVPSSIKQQFTTFLYSKSKIFFPIISLSKNYVYFAGKGEKKGCHHRPMPAASRAEASEARSLEFHLILPYG